MPTSDPNRVKIRIAFTGKSRETTVDIDSLTGCKCPVSGALYPDDMAIVAAIMKLVNDARAIYPPSS